MRFIKTFILHLYVDSDAPERLCGDIRPLDEAESYPFKNQIEFEQLLRRLVGKLGPAQVAASGEDACPDQVPDREQISSGG
jgi:hypothetical protein